MVMLDWLREAPFSWLLVAGLACAYLAATAIYTRVMILVVDRRDRAEKRTRPQASFERSPTTPSDPMPISVVLNANNEGRVAVEWERLSASDLEQVKRDLARRRSEMLARHQEELRALNYHQAEIDVLELAIDAFIEKYQLIPSTVWNESRGNHPALKSTGPTR